MGFFLVVVVGVFLLFSVLFVFCCCHLEWKSPFAQTPGGCFEQDHPAGVHGDGPSPPAGNCDGAAKKGFGFTQNHPVKCAGIGMWGL